MATDQSQNFLAQNAKQIGLAARTTLVRKQDLQPLTRNGGGATAK